MQQPVGDYSLLEKMNIQTNAVVINQCNEVGIQKIIHRGHEVIWINSNERGLSKSRNLAIQTSSADICVLADDDEVFVEGYEGIITKGFERNPNCALIRYMVEGIEDIFKFYPNKEHDIGYISSMKISSVEVAFKRKDVKDNNIKFDELIGAGTKYMMGEENAFSWECLRRKMKMKYIPVIIANLHIGNSSWFKGYDKDYFIGRGAAFTAMSIPLSKILILQFAIRRNALYRDQVGILKSIRLMWYGSKMYMRDREQKRKSLS